MKPETTIPEKYKLAEEKLNGETLTTDEERRIREITENKGYIKTKYIYLLRKKGYSKSEIMAILNINPKTFNKYNKHILSDQFLTNRINLEFETRQKEVEKKDFDVEKFDDYVVFELEKKITAILKSITPEKLQLASAPELARVFGILFDKYRTATGKSNFNILGIQAIMQSQDLDNKRLFELKKQLDNINLLLQSTENKNYYELKENLKNKEIAEAINE